MKKETGEKLWKNLKELVIVGLEECEKSAGIRVGRDETERKQYVDKTAGMVYGHLTDEIKITVKQFIVEVNKRTEKFN